MELTGVVVCQFTVVTQVKIVFKSLSGPVTRERRLHANVCPRGTGSLRKCTRLPGPPPPPSPLRSVCLSNMEIAGVATLRLIAIVQFVHWRCLTSSRLTPSRLYVYAGLTCRPGRILSSTKAIACVVYACSGCRPGSSITTALASVFTRPSVSAW